MRWECGAPLWASFCCARGMNCAMHWEKPEHWRRAGHARREGEIGAGGGGRIAVADARNARGRGATAGETGGVSGAGAAFDAVDLGSGVWARGHRRICAVYGLYPTLAAADGTGGLWRDKPAG